VQTVEAARQLWIEKLIDLSRRNNLLYFRPLKTGTLEFSSPDVIREIHARWPRIRFAFRQFKYRLKSSIVNFG